MARITFIDHLGVEHVVDAPEGLSVMEAAARNGVSGIDADCGGNCACATCHVYVDPAWLEQTGQAETLEASMLEFVENLQPNSRLSCQIRLSDRLDGLVVRTPESQH